MDMTEHNRIRELLISNISALCQGSVNFESEISVEGLLGITVDKKDVFLVNIKEVFHSPITVQPIMMAGEMEEEEGEEVPMPRLRAALESAEANVRKGKRKAQPHKILYDADYTDESEKRFKPDINNTAILNPAAFRMIRSDDEDDEEDTEEVEGVIGSIAIKAEPNFDVSGEELEEESNEAWLGQSPSLDEASMDGSSLSCEQNGDSGIKSEALDDSDLSASTSMNDFHEPTMKNLQQEISIPGLRL
ncbi:hypothetical protein CAPTEDRAFT_227038, partial [Capitella teleta]